MKENSKDYLEMTIADYLTKDEKKTADKSFKEIKMTDIERGFRKEDGYCLSEMADDDKEKMKLLLKAYARRNWTPYEEELSRFLDLKRRLEEQMQNKFLTEIAINLRKKTGMTQKEFSETYGIPKRTIENWELDITVPNRYTLKYLENAIVNDNAEISTVRELRLPLDILSKETRMLLKAVSQIDAKEERESLDEEYTDILLSMPTIEHTESGEFSEEKWTVDISAMNIEVIENEKAVKMYENYPADLKACCLVAFENNCNRLTFQKENQKEGELTRKIKEIIGK